MDLNSKIIRHVSRNFDLLNSPHLILFFDVEKHSYQRSMIPYHELPTEISKLFPWPFWYPFKSLIWLSCFSSNFSHNFTFTVSFNSFSCNRETFLSLRLSGKIQILYSNFRRFFAII